MSQSTSGCLRRRIAQPAFQLLKPFVGHRYSKTGVRIEFGAAAENFRLRRRADLIILPRLDDLILVLVKPPCKTATCVAREMQDLIFKLLDAHENDIRLRCFGGQTKRPSADVRQTARTAKFANPISLFATRRQSRR